MREGMMEMEIGGVVEILVRDVDTPATNF